MANYALSADGYAVVRLTGTTNLAASTLSTGLLTGYTTMTGSDGTLSITKYDAGFRGGTGGGEIEALYNFGAALGAGENLEWVQVVTTNLPLGGAVSPYLDNAGRPAQPFYTFTSENRDPSLPVNQLNFYDFSRRDPTSLAAADPITWNANLYPVVVEGTDLTIEDGVRWGWTMTKAMVGSTNTRFINPQPNVAVVSGVGTSTFVWGTPQPDSSSLSFGSTNFDAEPNKAFKLGRLTYHNGTIADDSGADSVEFELNLNFTNVPEEKRAVKTTFSLVNTLNTDDPIASADTVQIGNFNFTFNVVEGQTASVDLYGRLSTGLNVTKTGISADALFSPEPFDPQAHFELKLVGLRDASAGGFITPLEISFLPPKLGVASFGTSAGGWTDQEQYPRTFGDVNGDNMADVVGFGAAGTYVALTTGGGSFGAVSLALAGFGFAEAGGGWTNQDRYPRVVGDVNGDGKDDIVGFGEAGVFVSLATGAGQFAAPTLWLQGLGSSLGAGGWVSDDRYPRTVADVNGDGLDDVVAFGEAGISVALSTGSGQFAAPVLGAANFGSSAAAGGWITQDIYPRHLADADGDGLADIVAFGAAGAYVSLATGSGHFAVPILALAGFGSADAGGGWVNDTLYPRLVGDANGDGLADIIGFGEAGTFSAAGKDGGLFDAVTFESATFGASPAAGGWTDNDIYLRVLADVTGDFRDDIASFGANGVYISIAEDHSIPLTP